MNGNNIYFFVKISVTNENLDGDFRGGNVRCITYSSVDVSNKTNAVIIDEILTITVPRQVLHELPIPTKGTRNELLNYVNQISTIQELKEKEQTVKK